MRCQMMTFTGKMVNPLAMRAEDVDIRDIAHGLALVNRFGGHTRFPLPVAQHAVHVSQVMFLQAAKQGVPLSTCGDLAWIGLHHDDSDTYIGDMPRLLKHSPEMEGFLMIEQWLQCKLYECFEINSLFEHLGCGADWGKEALSYADNLVLRYEIREAMHPNFDKTVLEEQGLDPNLSTEELKLIGMWGPVSWQRAEEMYLEQAEKLRPGSVARYSK